jgi:hypothetical protein
MNSKAAQELPDAVTIQNSLRAVLSNYIQREKYEKKTNFDTVIQDRIISVKNYLKRKKRRFYTALTFFLIPVTYVASVYGLFANPLNILIFGSFLFLISFARQAYSSFIIRGNISSTQDFEKIGIKKAFYDIFFETITSVQLVYYYSIIIFCFFIAMAFLNLGIFNTVEFWIYKLGLLLAKSLKIHSVLFHPKMIYLLFFGFPLVYVLGDFTYWVINYKNVKRKYGNHS